jgi:predicted HTH transcriptional regulator
LLFGKNERVAELIPRSGVTAIRYAGDNANAPIVEKVEIKGNLLTLYESCIRFVKLYCDLWDEKPRTFIKDENSPVQARANYQQNVILEAIANALSHRDLALRDSQTRILIYDSFIEIINPRRTGGFTPPASRAIRYGITQRINPQIAAIFSNEAYEANLAGSNLPRLLRDSRLFAGRRAEIYTSNDEFKLKIYGI